MQTWYRIDLPLEDCRRNGKADQLQKAFEGMFLASQRPRDAALFEWHDEKFESNCFYFSPSACRVMQTLIEQSGESSVSLQCAQIASFSWLDTPVPTRCSVMNKESVRS